MTRQRRRVNVKMSHHWRCVFEHFTAYTSQNLKYYTFQSRSALVYFTHELLVQRKTFCSEPDNKVQLQDTDVQHLAPLLLNPMCERKAANFFVTLNASMATTMQNVVHDGVEGVSMQHMKFFFAPPLRKPKQLTHEMLIEGRKQPYATWMCGLFMNCYVADKRYDHL